MTKAEFLQAVHSYLQLAYKDGHRNKNRLYTKQAYLKTTDYKLYIGRLLEELEGEI